MISIYKKKWDYLKDQIEGLKPYVNDHDAVFKKIRILKNQASILKFAMEAEERGEESDLILNQMRIDRDYYSQNKY